VKNAAAMLRAIELRYARLVLALSEVGSSRR
jgi:hypothetical protein